VVVLLLLLLLLQEEHILAEFGPEDERLEQLYERLDELDPATFEVRLPDHGAADPGGSISTRFDRPDPQQQQITAAATMVVI
jgi:hypothetical protein